MLLTADFVVKGWIEIQTQQISFREEWDPRAVFLVLTIEADSAVLVESVISLVESGAVTGDIEEMASF